MILSNCYGRSLSAWMLYLQLPFRLGSRLYIIRLNEADVTLPVPFLQDHYLCALSTRTIPSGGES